MRSLWLAALFVACHRPPVITAVDGGPLERPATVDAILSTPTAQAEMGAFVEGRGQARDPSALQIAMHKESDQALLDDPSWRLIQGTTTSGDSFLGTVDVDKRRFTPLVVTHSKAPPTTRIVALTPGSSFLLVDSVCLHSRLGAASKLECLDEHALLFKLDPHQRITQRAGDFTTREVVEPEIDTVHRIDTSVVTLQPDPTSSGSQDIVVTTERTDLGSRPPESVHKLRDVYAYLVGKVDELVRVENSEDGKILLARSDHMPDVALLGKPGTLDAARKLIAFLDDPNAIVRDEARARIVKALDRTLCDSSSGRCRPSSFPPDLTDALTLVVAKAASGAAPAAALLAERVNRFVTRGLNEPQRFRLFLAKLDPETGSTIDMVLAHAGDGRVLPRVLARIPTAIDTADGCEVSDAINVLEALEQSPWHPVPLDGAQREALNRIGSSHLECEDEDVPASAREILKIDAERKKPRGR